MTLTDRVLVALFAVAVAVALMVPDLREGLHILAALTVQTIRETVALAAGVTP